MPVDELAALLAGPLAPEPATLALVAPPEPPSPCVEVASRPCAAEHATKTTKQGSAKRTTLPSIPREWPRPVSAIVRFFFFSAALARFLQPIRSRDARVPSHRNIHDERDRDQHGRDARAAVREERERDADDGQD